MSQPAQKRRLEVYLRAIEFERTIDGLNHPHHLKSE